MLPYLGVFVYLIARGGRMGADAAADAQANEAKFQQYVRETAGSTGTAEELERLKGLHDQGVLDDAEYAQAKAKVLAS